MKSRLLNTPNKIFTTNSGTTIHIDYDEKHRILEIGYIGEKVYHYHHVEPSVWIEYKNEVLLAGSSGKFVNLRIKPIYIEFEQLN